MNWNGLLSGRQKKRSLLSNAVGRGPWAVLRPSDLRLLLSERAELLATVERMRGALEKIERWHGEFPETGLFWLNSDGTESDRPMSYSAAWGSNGERDFMRGVARAALTTGEDK